MHWIMHWILALTAKLSKTDTSGGGRTLQDKICTDLMQVALERDAVQGFFSYQIGYIREINRIINIHIYRLL